MCAHYIAHMPFPNPPAFLPLTRCKASKDFDYTPSFQTAYLLHPVCLLECPSYEEYLDESGNLFVFLVDIFGFLEEFVHEILSLRVKNVSGHKDRMVLQLMAKNVGQSHYYLFIARHFLNRS